MSQAITPTTPGQSRLANFWTKRERVAPPSLPVKFGEQSGLATTYIIARTDGGVGASMLALMLESFHHERVAIIQVGGLRSWAFNGRSQGDFTHIIPHHDEDRISPPLDARVKQPDRVAIIEYEPGMVRQALEGATLLTEHFGAHLALCLIGSSTNSTFGLPDVARRQNVEPIVFRQHGIAPNRDPRTLKIPTVPRALAERLRSAPADFAHIADAWHTPIAGLTFEKNLNEFGKRIAESVG